MIVHQSLSGLSLRDFEYIQAVARNKSFGQAAIDCGISQPAISQQIRKLEARLGFPIFDRSAHSFYVTSAGEMILKKIDVILTEARALLDATASLDDPMEGELRLGIIPTLGPYLMPHILRAIRDQFPNLKLNLVEAPTQDLEEMVLTRQLDLVFLATVPESDELESQHWFDESYVLACPEEYELKEQISIQWSRFDQSELLLPSAEHCMRDQTMGFCNLATASGRRVGSSLEMLRQMVAAGEGVALLPALSVLGSDGINGLITYHPIAGNPLERAVQVCWRKNDYRIDAFTGFLSFLQTLHLPL